LGRASKRHRSWTRASAERGARLFVDVARIQAGGVTDPTWKIDADQPVSSVLWVDGGRVLVAGSFRNVNGDPHDGIALIGPGDTIFAGEMGDPLCVRP